MRRDETRAAFEEGAKWAQEQFRDVWSDPDAGEPELDRHVVDEGWRRSEARKRLEKPLD